MSTHGTQSVQRGYQSKGNSRHPTKYYCMTIIGAIVFRKVPHETERDASRKMRFTDKLDALELVQKSFERRRLKADKYDEVSSYSTLLNAPRG